MLDGITADEHEAVTGVDGRAFDSAESASGEEAWRRAADAHALQPPAERHDQANHQNQNQNESEIVGGVHGGRPHSGIMLGGMAVGAGRILGIGEIAK